MRRSPAPNRATSAYDGTMERTGDGGVIRFERRLAFPIRDVWDAITNPARLAEWWLPFDADMKTLAASSQAICTRTERPAVLAALSQIAVRFRTRVGESLATVKEHSRPLEEATTPSLDALKAAVSDRTAALLINNPDDMGIYNPHIKQWVEVVHDAGALAFYDHANFNGVMGKLKARDLGFDACMYMLHKTFGAPKTGGGPAAGAYGCTKELARFLPAPGRSARVSAREPCCLPPCSPPC